MCVSKWAGNRKLLPQIGSPIIYDDRFSNIKWFNFCSMYCLDVVLPLKTKPYFNAVLYKFKLCYVLDAPSHGGSYFEMKMKSQYKSEFDIFPLLL